MNNELNQPFIFSETLEVGQTTYDVVSQSGNRDKSLGGRSLGDNDYVVLKAGRHYMGKLTFHSDCSNADKLMLANSVISSEWFDVLTHKEFNIQIAEDSLESIQSLKNLGASSDLACAAEITFQVLTRRTDIRVDEYTASVTSLYDYFLSKLKKFDDADEMVEQLFEPWMNVYLLRQEGIADRLLRINKSISERRELFRYVDFQKKSIFDHHYDLDFSDSSILALITMDKLNFALPSECKRSLFAILEDFSREQWKELDEMNFDSSELSLEELSEDQKECYEFSKYFDFTNYPVSSDFIPHIRFIHSLITARYGQDLLASSHHLIESFGMQIHCTIQNLIAVSSCIEKGGDTKAPIEWIANLYSF